MIRNVVVSLIILALIVMCRPIPSPKPPAPISTADAGADLCDVYASSERATLAETAAAQGLSVDRVTRIFEGACEPFLEDGPDAAIQSGLSAARNARAAIVPDAG